MPFVVIQCVINGAENILLSRETERNGMNFGFFSVDFQVEKMELKLEMSRICDRKCQSNRFHEIKQP